MARDRIKAAVTAHLRVMTLREQARDKMAERDALIASAYEDGATIPELAVALGVSAETISKAVGRPRLASGRRNMPERIES